MLTLTVNGQKVSASPDQTILQVCREQKLDNIPTLCYDDKLPPFGSCFLCVVELEGQMKLFPSCATKVAEGMNVKTRSERVVRARKTCLELLLSDHYADCFGPCRLNCPADVDIQGYMSLAHFGKFKEAIALIKEKNPLPSVCGRVCTRKCELNCRRNLLDAPVGIDFLKRYIADQDMIGEMWQPARKPDNGQRVAIIGGGPAGLTCAYYLAIDGYRPAIFEALPELGGMLRYGIPEYRLPKGILDKEINWITNLGVEVHTSTALGKDITIDGLFQQGFKSVFIGLGAQVGKPMQVENEEAAGVLKGVEFLRQVEMMRNAQSNASALPGGTPQSGSAELHSAVSPSCTRQGSGENPAPRSSEHPADCKSAIQQSETLRHMTGRVVVVGGGNTAIDAARTALRLGASEVVLLYRRTRKEMPANAVEIEAAEHEGVKMEFLAAPTRVNVEGDRLASIECLRMELGEPDASGRRKPVPVKGSEFTLPCQWIISAIGQEADLTGVDQIKVTKWKTIEAKPGTFDVNRPGVFAGGDVVTGPADAIDAIASGRMAAVAIDKFIRTGVVTPITPRFESKRDTFHELSRTDLPPIESCGQHKPAEMSAGERIRSFAEVEFAYDDETAKTEALRCAECGCDVGLNCLLQDYCTEYGVDQSRFIGAFNRYKVDTRHPFVKIDSNKCIRCGRCVNTCAEILNVSALGFVNRGFRTIVKPALDKALQDTNCVSCGNCIDVCPTGALVEKLPFRRSGPWKMESHYSVCHYCGVGCNITLKAKATDLFFVTGAPPDFGPNQGELCIKGRFGYQHYLDGSRQKHPLVRRAGKLQRATWEEAFQAIQAGLGRVIEEHGRDAIMVSASPKLTNEELHLAGRLARAALGTNNLASFHRLANGADYHALDEMLGATRSTVTQADALNADLYLIVGCNPTAENPVLGWKIKRRMRHGAKAVVINSAQIDMVKHASVWADARRGTQTVLLNGIIAELIRRGQIDENFIATQTTGFAPVKESLLKHDLADVSSVTGVDRAQIEEVIALLATPNLKVVAIYNLESRVDRAPNDLKALATLLLAAGKLGTAGSGLALLNGQCNNNGLTAIFGSPAPNLSRKMREDKIRAAVILGENPMVAPDYHAFIANLEFRVVADLFLTETAQAADVFLPLSSTLESDGHITNWSGLRQRLFSLGKPPGGSTTTEILQRLCAFLGHDTASNSTTALTAELTSLLPSTGGDEAFPTPDGKAHFALYSAQITPSTPAAPPVLEIEARMTGRMQAISL
ncbi:MAG: molybdopterin-dependent oxidoreductase [Verrucomicrobia bacterium]|nr:molybdopterin-dependent oxidoreductase [Verrucomicrobiota bacterium]